MIAYFFRYRIRRVTRWCAIHFPCRAVRDALTDFLYPGDLLITFPGSGEDDVG